MNTKQGGEKVSRTIRAKYGDNFWREIGKKGGATKTEAPKGFAARPDLAVSAGRKGGTISRRGKNEAKR